MSQLNIIERIKYEFKNGSSLKMLIIINVLGFVFFELLYIFARLFKLPELSSWFENTFSMPGEFSELLWQPWSIFTSLFMHGDVLHLVKNMIVLYIVGQVFLLYFSSRKLILTFILGGIAGNILHVLSYDIFPYLMHLDQKGVIGASGAVYAILGAIFFYRPTYSLQLPFGINIPFWILALFFVLGDFTSLTRLDGIAHFAHIGGFLFGLISMIGVEKSSHWMNKFEYWVYGLNIKKLFKKKAKMKVHRNDNYRTMNDDQYREAKATEQERVNAVLDKISKGGYDSLSKSEKAFLFKFGNDQNS